MKYYSIGKFSDLIGKTPQTLRDWHKKGSFIPGHVTDGGTRYYSEEQLNHFLGIKDVEVKKKKIIGYCRVSNKKQQNDLERQIEKMKTYMIANGYSFSILSDIGSGVDYNKTGLNKLIDMITDSEIEKIVIIDKSRLLTIGFEIIEKLCNKYGTTIEIIDNSVNTEKQELVEDLVHIITSFGYKTQSKQVKKKIEELMRNDIRES